MILVEGTWDEALLCKTFVGFIKEAGPSHGSVTGLSMFRDDNIILTVNFHLICLTNSLVYY